MSMEYLIMQQKISDLRKEAEQRRLAREADTYDSLADNLEKIRQQLIERYTRKPQLLITHTCTEQCCTA